MLQMKKKKLLRMIEELEVQTKFRKAAVVALADAVKPIATFRYHYLMYAIDNDFVAADAKGIDEFFRWAFKRQDSQFSQEVQGPLTREEMLETFDEMVPSRKGKLEEILGVDRSDGEMGVWHKWANIVLGAEPHRNVDAHESNESESKQ
jgi:hypothetical protein